MTDEQNTTQVETLDTDYINTINQLKQNTVSKDEYNKLLDESRKLVNQLANNQPNPAADPQSVVSAPTTTELRAKLFGEHQLSDIEYCDTALKLRDNILREEGKDIFVANNSRYTPGQDSYDSAERVATVMRECIDYADGDNQAFLNELMRRTNDVMIPRRK